MAFFLFLSCVVPASQAAQPAPAKEAVTQWNLSPEGEHLYYYLLFTEALAQDNDDLLAEAFFGLLKLERSLPIFQDGAALFLARKKISKAMSIAEQGLSYYPEDPTLTVYLSGCYSENGSLGKAVKLLEDFLTRYPGASSEEVTQELIRLYLQQGKNERAQKLIEGFDRKSPPPAVSFFQAKLYITAGDLTRARSILRTLTKEYPEFLEAWLELGTVAEKRGNSTEAIAAYQRAVQIAPASPEVWYRIVMLQLETKSLAAALNTARQAPDKADFCLQASLIFSNHGNSPEAELLVKDAIAHGANADEAALYLSTIIMQASDDPLKAAAPLLRVKEKSPFFTKAAQRMAHLYLKGDQPERAYEIATRLRKAQPKDSDNWGLEAYILARLGKQKEAIELLQAEVQKQAGNVDLMFALGSIYDEVGQRDKAMQMMESIIKQSPRSARALNYVGYALAEENKDLDRALVLVKTALEEMPNAEYIIDSLAWVYYRKGDLPKAWEAIQRCLSLAEEDAAVWEHYAEIALAMGNATEAIRGYGEALKLDPDNATQLQEKLTQLQKDTQRKK